MKPSELTEYLVFAIRNRFSVLITGKPGGGKTDISKEATAVTGAQLIISHPVVSDPTDFKGLPFPGKNGTAEFLPYGDLRLIMSAKEETVYFIDDLGQASESVQAACMQLLLARRINGHKVSDKVTFIAATNRIQDRAGVKGLLEPVKSRFLAIIGLETDVNDWVKWALTHNMPTELIAFIRFRPELLDKFEPSKELVNTPSPRTVAAVGQQQAAGLPKKFEFEVFKGAAGEAFSAEYCGFLKLFRELPSIDEIILNPKKAPVPKDPGSRYAISSALAQRMNDQNIDAIYNYLDRLPIEISTACFMDATARDREVCNNRTYIQWAAKHAGQVL